MNNTIFLKHIDEFINIRTGNILHDLKSPDEEYKLLCDRRNKISNSLCDTYSEFIPFADIESEYIALIAVEVYKQALCDLLILQGEISWEKQI